MPEGNNRAYLDQAANWVLTLAKAHRLFQSRNWARHMSSPDNPAPMTTRIPERPTRRVEKEFVSHGKKTNPMAILIAECHPPGGQNPTQGLTISDDQQVRCHFDIFPLGQTLNPWVR
jgi:hypothetical protein